MGPIRKRKKRYTVYSTFGMKKDTKILIEIWSLKFLVLLNGHHDFLMSPNHFSSDILAHFLGFGEYVDSYTEEDKKVILAKMRHRLQEIEEKDKFRLPKILRKNIKKITNLIGLNNIEQEVFLFTIFLKYYDVLDEAACTMSDVTTDKLIFALSILLDRSPKKIKKAFDPKSRLAQSGLVTVSREQVLRFTNKLEMLSDDFVDKMMTLDGDIEEMVRDSIRKCEASILTVKNFDHLYKDLEILLPYLEKVVMSKERGVNILFYGKPGTGKTELTKVITQTLNVQIYEVSYANSNDEPVSGNERLKAYKVGQSFFSKGNVLLMFDEIEDVIGNDEVASFFSLPKQKHKGWMNRMLENNPIPTIWITNDIDSMDPALVRRFDMSLEIPIPPKSKRREVIEKDCGNFLSDMMIDKISKSEFLSPAVVNRTAKVISHIGKIKNVDDTFEHIINHTLKAQGYPLIKNEELDKLPKSYDVEYIHTDIDLNMFVEGIKENPNARVCLYGVPGTGKSAFGKWIAEITEKPVLLKKGSDLMSMYVGGTEKNIARAFSEAKDEGAVLIFDEVDSFLQNRETAQRSWEVTQVNELLVQMESFNGIFIATTNLMDELDSASLRRFDLKLEFKYLKPQQAWKLFETECKLLGLRYKDKKELKKYIGSMSRLTPGDFAVVRRQHKFQPIRSADDFVKRLEKELVVKGGVNLNKIGFI